MKFRLTDNKRKVGRTNLYQIEALKNFNEVKAGELGGWLQTESNLSQEGDCWVGNGAVVYDAARVVGNAMVTGQTRVFGMALISDDARILDEAEVYGHARVQDKALVSLRAKVYGHSVVRDNAKIYGEAHIFGASKIFDYANIAGRARIYGDAMVHGYSEVDDQVRVYDNAHIEDTYLGENSSVYGYARVRHASVSGQSKIFGDFTFNGNFQFRGNASIVSSASLLLLGPAKSSGRFTTAHRDSKIGIRINCGCFSGTVAEFISAIEKTHAFDTKALKQYRAFVQLIKINFDLA